MILSWLNLHLVCPLAGYHGLLGGSFSSVLQYFQVSDFYNTCQIYISRRGKPNKFNNVLLFGFPHLLFFFWYMQCMRIQFEKWVKYIHNILAERKRPPTFFYPFTTYFTSLDLKMLLSLCKTFPLPGKVCLKRLCCLPFIRCSGHFGCWLCFTTPYGDGLYSWIRFVFMA